MSGFNIGEIYGLLKLDNSQYLEALEKSGAESALLSVRLANLYNNDLKSLQREFANAGFSVKSLNDLVRQFYTQGYSKPEAVEAINRAVMELRGRLREAVSELAELKIQANGVQDSKLNARARGEVTEPFAAQLALLQKIAVEEQSKELENHRAIIEAERIRIRQIQERVAKETDYRNLTSRLAKEQADAEGRLKNAKLEAINENDRILKPQRDANAKHLKEMASMREMYTKESVAAETAAAAKAAKEQADLAVKTGKAREQADKAARDNAIKNQKEVIDQVAGNAAYEERIEREKQAELESIRRKARQDEKNAFVQYHRDMQKASALTTIGTTAGVAGAAGIGAGLFVANDAAKFKDAMVKSLADIGDISTQMQAKLSNAAREAAKDTGIHAKEIAADYAIMAKGGLTAAQSLQFIPAATKFAVATNSELHESTKQIITIMEALQIPFSEVGSLMDKLTFANNIARGSVDQLATSLEGRAGAALRSAKVSIDEALAITIAFSKAGVTASQSQTYVTQIIEKLRSAAVDYGREIVTVGDKQMRFRDIVYLSDGTMRPFVQTLKLLDEAFKGRSAESLNRFFADLHIGSSRGGQALKILLGATESLDLISGRLGKTSGQTMHNFDIMMQSPIRQLEVLKAKMTDVAITLGGPVVAAMQSTLTVSKPLLDGIASLAAKFAELPAGLQATIVGVFGVGSVALVAGGGLLVFLGHMIRLRADLLLLNQSGVMTGFTTFLTGVGALAAKVAIPIAALVGAIVALRSEYDRIKKDQDTNGKRQDGLGIAKGDSFYGFGYHPSSSAVAGETTGQSQSLAEHRRSMEAAKSAGDKLLTRIGSDTAGESTDAFRETLEKMKEFKNELLKLGDIGVDPEKILKQHLKVETLRQAFQAFSDAYNKEIEHLTESEQDVMMGLFAKLGDQLANGMDLRLVKKSLDDAEAQLKRFRSEAAERERQHNIELAKKNALESVKAFTTQYEQDMRAFSSDQKSKLDAGVENLWKLLETGANPKDIAAELRNVKNEYEEITGEIDAALHLQNKLNKAVREWDARERKETRENPQIAGFESRIPPALLAQIEANRSRHKDDDAVSSVLKGLGVGNNGQAALDLQRVAAEGLYKELQQLEHGAHDEHTALVAMWEAEAAAAHVAVTSVSNAARIHYREYKAEVQNSVIASNRAWKESLQEIGRGIRKLVSDFSGGLLDIVFPKHTDTKDKLGPLVTAFRDVYEQLSAYSDPKRALDGVIKAIQTAGTTAQANAIAVKYFGKEAGPNLARELRDGTISAKDIAEAIDRATKSTTEYGNETEKALSKISSLWHALVTDLLKIIVEQLIKLGFKALIGVIFDVSTAHKTLTEVIEEAWSKVWNKIKGVKDITEEVAKSAGAAAASIGAGAAGQAGEWVMDETGQWVNIGGDAAKTVGNAGNSVANTATTAVGAGISGIVNMVSGIVSAVSSVIGNFQMAGMNKSLDIIVKHTLQAANDLANLRRDEWDREMHLMAKLDDIWKEFREGTVFGQLRLIVSKLDEFIIPALMGMNTAMTTGSFATGTPYTPAIAGGGTMDQSFNVTGPITVVANKPEEFVRDLKRRRIVRGVR